MAPTSHSGRRVVCPDLVGRGKSGRLQNADEYALPQYCADINALIARIGADTVDYLGTSLGGLIGMVLAGLPGNCGCDCRPDASPTPIQNDTGCAFSLSPRRARGSGVSRKTPYSGGSPSKANRQGLAARQLPLGLQPHPPHRAA